MENYRLVGTNMEAENNLRELVQEPYTISDLSPTEIADYLQKLSKSLDNSSTNPVLIKFGTKGELILVGDTHGDFTTTCEIVRSKFLVNPKNRYLVFLGDYIDRTPLDLRPFGAINNITYLLILKLAYPDRVYLLKGNHEAIGVIECEPYEFCMDLIIKFGRLHGVKLHTLYLDVFAKLPLMIKTANGIFGAHGGIYKKARGLSDLMKLDRNDEFTLSSIVWSDPKDYGPYRGPIGDNFNSTDLQEFLKRIDAKVMIRGHDYGTLGYSIYNNRCLTIFSSRLYASRGNGGVLVAHINLSQPIRSATDIPIEDWSTGVWKKYKIGILG
jgi:predicted phosphodiesterase